MKKIVISLSLTIFISQNILAQEQEEDLNMGLHQLQFLSASGGNNRIQSFGGYSPGSWLFKSRFDNIIIDAGENDSNRRKILFMIGGIERARFENDGKFGIGTDNPQYHLHVAGDAKIDGTLGDTYLGTNQLQFLSASGGNNRIQSFGGYSPGSWLFKSRFDNIIIDAGENDSNRRKILFMIGGIERARFENDGKFGIGTDNPKNELSVNGTIWAKEVKVSLEDGADWVFEDDYELKTLEEVEGFIKQNKHLPEIPSAEEFRQNDLNIAEMDNKLLQKIEELTLYMIDMNKRVKELEQENSELKNEISLLKEE